MFRTIGFISSYAIFLVLPACVGGAGIKRSEQFLAAANYRQAYWAVEEARRKRPNDPVLERRFWELRVIYLLAEARDLVFHDRDLDALRMLERVQVLDRDNAVAQTWIRKAKRKLALRANDEGRKQLIGGELSDALRSFNEALSYQPDDPEALVGIEELDAIWATCRDAALQRYLKGLRAMAEQQYVQTDYQSNIAIDLDPSLDRARKQQTRALKRLAEERFDDAREMEKVGYFAPALNDYLHVREVLPETPGIDAAIERMETEVRAEKLAHAGEMAVLRGDFEEARGLLEEAFEICTVSKISIGEKLQLVAERELDYMYMEAKDLELEYQYEEAVDAYKAIAEAARDGYQDVIARINDLEASITAAENGYSAGLEDEAAGRLIVALDRFQEVLIHYPGYKDLEDRVRDLKARIGDASKKSGSAC